MQSNKYNLEFFKDHSYFHISHVVDKTLHMMDAIREGKLAPIVTSLKTETEHIGGYYPTDQVVIAARSGAGKTAKAIHEMDDFCNASLNPFYAQNFMILYDSYEMADWRNVLRMISREGGIEAKALLDYHRRLTEERLIGLKAIAEKFRGYPVFISTRPKTVDQWAESKKWLQDKYPTSYIMNIYDHSRLAKKKDEGKEEEKLTGLMNAGIDLKNNYNMINIFLNQMNRNIETATARDRLGTQLPIASDIFGSDAIFQSADIVKALHRPGMYGLEFFNDLPTGIDMNDPNKPDTLMLEVILKQREGYTGVLKLTHNLAHNQFYDYAETAKFQPPITEDF